MPFGIVALLPTVVRTGGWLVAWFTRRPRLILERPKDAPEFSEQLLVPVAIPNPGPKTSIDAATWKLTVETTDGSFPVYAVDHRGWEKEVSVIGARETVKTTLRFAFVDKAAKDRAVADHRLCLTVTTVTGKLLRGYWKNAAP
jgi:hypothetical protein